MPGQDIEASGTLLVSFTDFTVSKLVHLPAAALAGYSLRRGWPEMSGAVGVWLWTAPLRRRCGSLSIWTSEEALRAFVRTPDHLAIVRAYRGRGAMQSRTWSVGSGMPRREIRALAEEYIAGPGASVP